MRALFLARRVTAFSLLFAVNIFGADASLEDLRRMAARFAPVELRPDTRDLSAGDRAALIKLIAAARFIDRIFLRQTGRNNEAIYSRLLADHSPLGMARASYFWLNKGPWSELDGHRAFLDGVPAVRPPGAGFYPEDMTRPEFESWVRALNPQARAQAEGFFTIIVRDQAGLRTVPYSQAWQADLRACANLLKEAADLTGNATLQRFLRSRAEALLSNDYYRSDVDWMDLDAPLDITLGPYETYNDEIFGYKASFEAYVNIRDEAATARLKLFSDHLQEVEDNLPVDPRYRNPKLGSLAPIRVVNEVIASGDADHGVKTAAYNLPNDERVVREKGSKRVMLRNVQEAKFHTTLEPIAKAVLTPARVSQVNFDAFFTHILAHEMSHGIGPHVIGRGTSSATPRQELKELYGVVEEAKADVLGLFLLQLFYDKGYLKPSETSLYTTYLASAFRTLRFGTGEAHARGMALQFNFLADAGAFVRRGDAWDIDLPKMRGAVRSLARALLTIEATGNYGAAKKLLDSLGAIRPATQATLKTVERVPVDIAPVFSAARDLGSR